MKSKTDAVIILAIGVSILFPNSIYLIGLIKSKPSESAFSTIDSKNTYPDSGEGLFLTNAILLILSFCMMLSGFDNIFHAGLILSASIFSSLIVILILLPAFTMNVVIKHSRFPKTEKV